MLRQFITVILFLSAIESAQAQFNAPVLNFRLSAAQVISLRQAVLIAQQKRAQLFQNVKKGKCEIITDTNIASNASETGASCFEKAAGLVSSNKEFYLFHPLKINWDGKDIYGKDQVVGIETQIIPALTSLKVSYGCSIVPSPVLSGVGPFEVKFVSVYR